MNTTKRTPSQRIAAMINANVAALNSRKITLEQFRVVNDATWRLADGDHPNIIGSRAWHRTSAVLRILNRVQQ